MVFIEPELVQKDQLQNGSFYNLKDYEKMAKAKTQRDSERTSYKNV